MLNTLLQPNAEIARFVRVKSGEDGLIDVFVAENFGGNFDVQRYVGQLEKQYPGLIRLAIVSLDEMNQVAITPTSEVTSHSVNQQRVLNYFRKAIALSASDLHFTIGRDGSEFCFVEARVHGELQRLDCINKEEGMALASTI
ncbi:MAG TPA: type II secretion protein E, partial [Arsenophonus apicola]